MSAPSYCGLAVRPTHLSPADLSPTDVPGQTLALRLNPQPAERLIMLHYAVVFLVIALIAAVLGFGGLAAGAAGIAKVLFVVFVVMAIVTFFIGQRR